MSVQTGPPLSTLAGLQRWQHCGLSFFGHTGEIPRRKSLPAKPHRSSAERQARTARWYLAAAFSRRLAGGRLPCSHFKRAAAATWGIKTGTSRDIQPRFTKGPCGSERRPARLSRGADCTPMISQQVRADSRAGPPMNCNESFSRWTPPIPTPTLSLPPQHSAAAVEGFPDEQVALKSRTHCNG